MSFLKTLLWPASEKLKRIRKLDEEAKAHLRESRVILAQAKNERVENRKTFERLEGIEKRLEKYGKMDLVISREYGLREGILAGILDSLSLDNENTIELGETITSEIEKIVIPYDALLQIYDARGLPEIQRVLKEERSQITGLIKKTVEPFRTYNALQTGEQSNN